MSTHVASNFQSQRTEELRQRFYAKVEKTDCCWIWKGAVNGAGYGLIYVDGKTYRATSIVWEIETGKYPNSYVLHHCDNPLCVRIDHLFLGNAKINHDDAVRKGRKMQSVPIPEFQSKDPPLEIPPAGFRDYKRLPKEEFSEDAKQMLFSYGTRSPDTSVSSQTT
jgi:hypothetical protein